jgi:hypothetical protein
MPYLPVQMCKLLILFRLIILRCKGFVSECITNIPEDVFSGFSSSCLKYMTKNSLYAINSQQISKLSLLAVAGIDYNQIQALNPTSCSGFILWQISSLRNEYPSVACKGFTAECLSNIQTLAIPGMDEKCTSALNPESLKFISSQQVAAMSFKAISGFNQNHLAVINPQSCNGFSSPQLNSLSTAYPSSACKGITQMCLTHIPSISLTGMSAECVGTIDPKTVVSFSAYQIGNLTANAVTGFVQNQMIQLTDACAGFSIGQLNSLTAKYPNSVCMGIQAACIHAIKPSNMAGFKPDCISLLPANAFSTISSKSISNISLQGISGITKQLLENINIDACAGFSNQQVNSFNPSYPTNVCQGMKAECMAKIPAVSYPGLQESCFNQFKDDILSKVSSDQLGFISIYAAKSITSSMISNLPATSCSGFQKGHMEVLSQRGNHCRGLNRQCISCLTESATSGMGSICIKEISSADITGFSKRHFPSFTVDAVSAFDENHLKALITNYNGDFIETMTLLQLSKADRNAIQQLVGSYENGVLIRTRELSASEIGTVSWLQLAASTPASIVPILLTSIQSLSVYSFNGIAGDVIIRLTDNVLANLSHDQLVNILFYTFNKCSANQVSNIPISEFDGRVGAMIHLFRAISPAAIPGVTREQLRLGLHSNGYLESMHCSQFAALISLQIDTMKETNFSRKILSALQQRCSITPTSPGPTTSSTYAPYATSTYGPSTTADPKSSSRPTPLPKPSSASKASIMTGLITAVFMLFIL